MTRRIICKAIYEKYNQKEQLVHSVEIKIMTTVQHGVFCFWIATAKVFAFLKLNEPTTILDNYLPRALCTSFGKLKHNSVQCKNWSSSSSEDETDDVEFVNIVGLYHLYQLLDCHEALLLLSWIHTKMLPRIMFEMAPSNYIELQATAPPLSEYVKPEQQQQQQQQAVATHDQEQQNKEVATVSDSPPIPINKSGYEAKKTTETSERSRFLPIAAFVRPFSKPPKFIYKPTDSSSSTTSNNEWRWGDCKYGTCKNSCCN